MVKEIKAEDFCRTVSNFSLEYRTTQQTILLQREREHLKSGRENPGPNTPAAKKKHQKSPSQVLRSVKCHCKINTYIEFDFVVITA